MKDSEEDGDLVLFKVTILKWWYGVGGGEAKKMVHVLMKIGLILFRNEI